MPRRANYLGLVRRSGHAWLTGAELASKQLTPNVLAKKAVEAYREDRDKKPAAAPAAAAAAAAPRASAASDEPPAKKARAAP